MRQTLTCRFLRWLSWVIAKTFFGLKMYGRGNIPARGGFLLASNHLSFLDPILMGVAAAPRPLKYMARDTLFRNFFFGWLLRQVGAFPLKRNSADLGALKEGMRCVREGNGLFLFPEGRRREAGQAPGKPQAGVGFLAQKLNVPVVPAFVCGTDKVLPKGARMLRRHRITIYIGAPVEIQSGMEYQEIADLVMEHIRGLDPALNMPPAKAAAV